MNFVSNDPDEIKKEKEKNAALHSLFPLTMRGSEKGAFRHTIWQAKIASKYGKNIAKQVGNAHENDPYVNLYQRSFKNIDDADKL